MGASDALWYKYQGAKLTIFHFQKFPLVPEISCTTLFIIQEGYFMIIDKKIFENIQNDGEIYKLKLSFLSVSCHDFLTFDRYASFSGFFLSLINLFHLKSGGLNEELFLYVLMKYLF